MQTRPSPPQTRVDVVTDEMHGHRVEDPYRWLENADSTDTQQWTAGQNAYTESLLRGVPGRDALKERLEALLTVGAVSSPAMRDSRFFYMRRDGRQNQPVLYVRDGAEGEDRVLLDPNAASSEGTVALDWWYP